MKNKAMLIFSVFVIGVFVASSVSAQGIPGTGWWTGEQVQNVGTGTATIALTAYDKNSSGQYTVNVTATTGSAVTLGPLSNFTPALPSPFQGSAIVSSDQPIKAIVNVTNQQSGSLGVAGGKAAAQYQGTESAANTLYFPLVKNNRFGNTTAFYIQNAGSADTTVRAVFKMDSGSVFTYTSSTINAGKMVMILPGDAGVPSTPSNSTRVNIGSMSVTSLASQPLAGTVLEFTEGETIATALKGTRGFTSADFDTKAYAPVVKRNRFGRFTGIQVQNVSAAPITVTIDYVGSAATCKGVATQDVRTNIAPNASTTVVQGTGSNFSDNCTGSATIGATGNFVAIVNEDSLAGFPKSASMYYAMPNHTATLKVSAPLFKNNRYGFDTGLQIQNVGVTTATNVVATFICKGNNSSTPFTAISTPQIVGPGAAKLFFKPYDNQASDFTVGNPFSLTGANCGVTVTSDQNIVAIANETPRTAGALDDNNYEAFNLTP